MEQLRRHRVRRTNQTTHKFAVHRDYSTSRIAVQTNAQRPQSTSTIAKQVFSPRLKLGLALIGGAVCEIPSVWLWVVVTDRRTVEVPHPSRMCWASGRKIMDSIRSVAVLAVALFTGALAGAAIAGNPVAHADDTTVAVAPLSIASGAVVAFDRTSCPSGRSEFAPAQGRLVVGLNPGGDLRGKVGPRNLNGSRDFRVVELLAQPRQRVHALVDHRVLLTVATTDFARLAR